MTLKINFLYHCYALQENFNMRLLLSWLSQIEYYTVSFFQLVFLPPKVACIFWKQKPKIWSILVQPKLKIILPKNAAAQQFKDYNYNSGIFVLTISLLQISHQAARAHVTSTNPTTSVTGTGDIVTKTSTPTLKKSEWNALYTVMVVC